MASAVLGVFAALSIILAVLGVHGVMSYAISQQSLAYGVSSRDPVITVVTAATLACVGVGATWWPRWRAARANPVHALRAE